MKRPQYKKRRSQKRWDRRARLKQMWIWPEEPLMKVFPTEEEAREWSRDNVEPDLEGKDD